MAEDRTVVASVYYKFEVLTYGWLTLFNLYQAIIE